MSRPALQQTRFEIFKLSEIEVAIPADELFYYVPNGEVENDFEAFKTEQDNATVYVRKGRYFSPEYLAQHQDRIASRAAANQASGSKFDDQTKLQIYLKDAAKKRTPIDTYKAEAKRLREKVRNLKHENERLEQSEEACWKAFRAFAEALKRAEDESDFSRHKHEVGIKEAQARHEAIRAKLFSNQTAIEREMVEDGVVAREYKSVLSGLNECMNFLRFNLFEDRLAQCPDRFDPEATGIEGYLEFDHGLFKWLLEGAWNVVETHTDQVLAQWRTIEGDSSIDVEKMMNQVREDLVDAAECLPGLQGNPQKQREQNDLITKKQRLLSEYYVWRSYTARMHESLTREFSDEWISQEDAKRKITGQLLRKLRSHLSGRNEDGTMPLFDVKKKLLEKRQAEFDKKFQVFVGRALQLSKTMRKGRCCYELKWFRGQEWREDIANPANTTSPQVSQMIQYCISPALVKFGESDGQNISSHKVLHKAEVLLHVDRSTSVEENTETTASDGTSKERSERASQELEKSKSGWISRMFGGGRTSSVREGSVHTSGSGTRTSVRSSMAQGDAFAQQPEPGDPGLDQSSADNDLPREHQTAPGSQNTNASDNVTGRVSNGNHKHSPARGVAPAVPSKQAQMRSRDAAALSSSVVRNPSMSARVPPTNTSLPKPSYSNDDGDMQSGNTSRRSTLTKKGTSTAASQVPFDSNTLHSHVTHPEEQNLHPGYGSEWLQGARPVQAADAYHNQRANPQGRSF